MLDRTERNGRIQVEIKPYHAAHQNSFAIEVGGADSELYRHLGKAWGQLMVDARELEGIFVPADTTFNQSDKV